MRQKFQCDEALRHVAQLVYGPQGQLVGQTHLRPTRLHPRWGSLVLQDAYVFSLAMSVTVGAGEATRSPVVSRRIGW